eukprot:scaffold87764_cov17-Tisochrysis_lutea.AAC.1
MFDLTPHEPPAVSGQMLVPEPQAQNAYTASLAPQLPVCHAGWLKLTLALARAQYLHEPRLLLSRLTCRCICAEPEFAVQQH